MSSPGMTTDERDRFYQERMNSLQKLMDERDRLYMNSFKASEVAVAAALAGSEKAVNAAFLASEKAVLKAEQAQKEYNERSNEFRGQLDDQAKMLMPRTESLTMFKALEEKVTRMDSVADSRTAVVQDAARNDLSAFIAAYKTAHDVLAKDVAALREENARMLGKDKGIGVSWGVVLGVVALIGSLLTIWTLTTENKPTAAPMAPQVVYVPAPAASNMPAK